jgi:hypothetical protein
MWWSSLLAGNWIDWGEALIFGEGRAGAVYSWKECKSGGRRVYSSAELSFSQIPAYSVIRAGCPCVKSGGECLGIFRVNIRALIGPANRTAGRLRELGGGVVDSVFLDF